MAAEVGTVRVSDSNTRGTACRTDSVRMIGAGQDAEGEFLCCDLTGGVPGTWEVCERLREPSGFTWTSSGVAVVNNGVRSFRTVPETTTDLTTVSSTGTTYYVDPVGGNDANSGTSRVDALQSVNAALGKADVDVVALEPGRYRRSYAWSGGTSPTRDVYIYVLDNGTATMSAHDPLAWSLHSGSAYKATRNNVETVWDNVLRDQHGDYSMLIEQSTIQEVIDTPGSWIESGGEVYVHTRDGRQPETNFPVFLTLTGPKIEGEVDVYVENVGFEGWSTPMTIASTDASNAPDVWMHNAWFKYSSSGNGLTVTGARNVYCSRCQASNNYLDGLSYKVLNTIVPNFLEISCRGTDNGRSGGDINNGSTGHDGVQGIRVNGYYGRNQGPNVADVSDGTKTWNIGCEMFESRAPGGTPAQITNLAVTDDADIYLESCVLHSSLYSMLISDAASAVYECNTCYDGDITGSGTLERYCAQSDTCMSVSGVAWRNQGTSVTRGYYLDDNLDLDGTLYNAEIDGGDSGATTLRAADAATMQQRSHNTDCTSLADGKRGELCHEEDDDTLYICEPTSGDCDTAGEWIQLGGTLSGPVSSTDNAIVRWNGTGGDTIQNSGVTVDDSNNLDAAGFGEFSYVRVPDSFGVGYVKIEFDGSGFGKYVIDFGEATNTYPGEIHYNGTLYQKVDPTTGASGTVDFYKPFRATQGGQYSLNTSMSENAELAYDADNSLTAAGTTQGTATQLSCQVCRVTTVTASNNGVKVPACTTANNEVGMVSVIINSDAADSLKVYPQTGGTVGPATNNPVTVPAGDAALCECYTDNAWVCTSSAYLTS